LSIPGSAAGQKTSKTQFSSKPEIWNETQEDSKERNEVKFIDSIADIMRQKNNASGYMDKDQTEKDQSQINIFMINAVFFMRILSPGKYSG